MWDRIQLRITGQTEKPVLIYLPGLHGDWTLIANFKQTLADRVRFVEITYPRTTVWSLNQYASGVLDALASAGIRTGWLLGESFGSQVVWKMLRQGKFAAQGVILAGGFVRHPMPMIVPAVQWLNRNVPMPMLKAFCRVYGVYAKFRHRRAPNTLSDLREFIARRTEEADRQALLHRYALIRANDLCQIATAAAVPIFQLSGLCDPVVPWLPVRRWLKAHCAAYRGSKVIWYADHHVLGTAPEASARQILDWINGPH